MQKSNCCLHYILTGQYFSRATPGKAKCQNVKFYEVLKAEESL